MIGKHLLIVEDDATTRRLLKNYLENEGFEVTAVDDGPPALESIQKNGFPHLIILDIGLPTTDGFILGQEIKKVSDVPIIFLTGNRSEETIVQGIEEFADDYITKPFNVKEVNARIRRILSRLGDHSYANKPAVEIDEHLTIDFANQQALVDGDPRDLTPKEIKLLYILLHNRGRAVSTETLIARIWPGEDIFEDTVRVNVFRLRRKLEGEDQTKEYIITERGLGYTFAAPEEQDVATQ